MVERKLQLRFSASAVSAVAVPDRFQSQEKDGEGHFLSLVSRQNAVSMYCRLGFAVKKGQVFGSEQLHPTWKNAPSVNRLK